MPLLLRPFETDLLMLSSGGGWTDKKTAAEVLENLKAAYAAFEIIEELVMTTEEARELAEATWAA